MAEAEPKAPRLKLSLADFELLRRVGDGSYSHVVLARHRATDREYALKVIDKQYIIRHKAVDSIRRERQVLDRLKGHPGVAELFFTFQDALSLYLGLEYCPNGELYDQVRLKGRLEEATAAFYAAEVVEILAHLRAHCVVHRDLKPENLLLDGEGHLKLIDFGSAKQLGGPEEAVPAAPAGASTDVAAGGAPEGEQEGEQAGQQPEEAADGDASSSPGSSSSGEAGGGRGKRAVSLVGTADYVSPEILNNRPVSCAADLWALGCVIFQMLAGAPPFKSPSEYLTFQKIVEAQYELPAGISPEAADLIARLLQVEPASRIGAADLAELRGHAFFRGIDWAALRSQPAPDFVPDLDPALSSANSSFDWELQSLASALPHLASEGEHLSLSPP